MQRFLVQETKKTKNKTNEQTLCYVIEKSFLHFEQARKASYTAKVSFADSGPSFIAKEESDMIKRKQKSQLTGLALMAWNSLMAGMYAQCQVWSMKARKLSRTYPSTHVFLP